MSNASKAYVIHPKNLENHRSNIYMNKSYRSAIKIIKTVMKSYEVRIHARWYPKQGIRNPKHAFYLKKNNPNHDLCINIQKQHVNLVKTS